MEKHWDVQKNLFVRRNKKISEFKIPNELRKELINTYILLIAVIDSVGVYKDKVDGLTTE